MATDASPLSERRAIVITGIVQGVGFRPFVFRLATQHGLRGFVKNQHGGVRVEVEGSRSSLDGFLQELASSQPPLARVDSMSMESRPLERESDFRIVMSGGGTVTENIVPPDIGTCAECLTELFDPSNRRYRYPFITCTDCGPRLTIVEAVPFDRERTTMSAFVLCPPCRAEYEDPADRRFHAETMSCAACGPRLQVLDRVGETMAVADPIAYAAGELLAGRIGALKGLGGFHLMCDARHEVTVNELRRRKMRDEKPFAIMAADLAEAAKLCLANEDEARLLASPPRPIVLLRKRAGATVATSVAPGHPCLGMMLPYTPPHHLLLRQMGGVPLVMTSANRRDEPIAYQDSRRLAELGGMADFYLTHNRVIHSRCDDSVMRICGGRRTPLRRSRGFAPAPIVLPAACPEPILALGGQMKAVFALGWGARAILSHHLGELEHPEAFGGFMEAVSQYERLFGFEPKLLVHDLHPDYASTTYALQRARRDGLRSLAAQHHHAHLASCMAENGLKGPVIGVAFDGTGLGADGAVWGGEFLVAHYASFERVAHLRYVAMPGGQVAIRQPWRMAFAHLADAGEDTAKYGGGASPQTLAALGRMIESGFNTPLTSSCGRLFDAVAAMMGLRREVDYEGQAAIELEGLALQTPADIAYPFVLNQGLPIVIDTRSIIVAVARDLRDGVEKSRIARRFHSTIIELTLNVCVALRKQFGLSAAALSGGVFMNSILAREIPLRLEEIGFSVHCHSEVPPNDGGLSLGQLAIAAAQKDKS